MQSKWNIRICFRKISNLYKMKFTLLCRDVVQTKKIQLSGSGEPMQKEKFENITVTEKHTDTFVPFESILDVPKASLPKESEIYYMILSKCIGKLLQQQHNSHNVFLSVVLLNYREKHKKDPLPSERGSEDFKAEAEKIIKKYDLENRINNLLE